MIRRLALIAGLAVTLAGCAPLEPTDWRVRSEEPRAEEEEENALTAAEDGTFELQAVPRELTPGPATVEKYRVVYSSWSGRYECQGGYTEAAELRDYFARSGCSAAVAAMDRRGAWSPGRGLLGGVAGGISILVGGLLFSDWFKGIDPNGMNNRLLLSGAGAVTFGYLFSRPEEQDVPGAVKAFNHWLEERAGTIPGAP